MCKHILQDIFKHISNSLRFAQMAVSVLVHYHNDNFACFVKIFSTFFLWRFPCVLRAFNLRRQFILACCLSFHTCQFWRHVLSVGRYVLLQSDIFGLAWTVGSFPEHMRQLYQYAHPICIMLCLCLL